MTDKLTIADIPNARRVAQLLDAGAATPEGLAAYIGEYDSYTDSLVLEPNVWYVNDGYDSYKTGEPSAEAALDHVAERGDYESCESTSWLTLRAYREGLDCFGGTVECNVVERQLTIEPTPPKCRGIDHEHIWLDSGNVWGSGGGVKWTECCPLCGTSKHRDTWAQNPETGEQGLDGTRYCTQGREIGPQEALKLAGMDYRDLVEILDSDNDTLITLLDTTTVTAEDAAQAGACSDGVARWIAKHGEQTIRELLDTRDDAIAKDVATQALWNAL